MSVQYQLDPSMMHFRFNNPTDSSTLPHHHPITTKDRMFFKSPVYWWVVGVFWTLVILVCVAFKLYSLYEDRKKKLIQSTEQQSSTVPTQGQHLLRDCPRTEAAYRPAPQVALTIDEPIDDDFSVFPPSQRAALAALETDGNLDNPVEMTIVNIDDAGNQAAGQSSRRAAPSAPYDDLPPTYEEAVGITHDITRTPSYDEAIGNTPTGPPQPDPPSRNSPPPAYYE